ncbi:hypothetical protein KIPB_014587, partial [Kipferlia bialata]|eukprot:g14587.t1
MVRVLHIAEKPSVAKLIANSVAGNGQIGR